MKTSPKYFGLAVGP